MVLLDGHIPRRMPNVTKIQTDKFQLNFNAAFLKKIQTIVHIPRRMSNVTKIQILKFDADIFLKN